jgi:hypothetical protein
MGPLVDAQFVLKVDRIGPDFANHLQRLFDDSSLSVVVQLLGDARLACVS